MNAYEINGYTIAAKNADHAFAQYMEETDGMSGIYIGDVQEGETEEITITVRRLTENQMDIKDLTCCGDGSEGCELCEGKDDIVWLSYREVMDQKKETDFPCVIAKEE